MLILVIRLHDQNIYIYIEREVNNQHSEKEKEICIGSYIVLKCTKKYNQEKKSVNFNIKI
jgi:hypothetical protein